VLSLIFQKRKEIKTENPGWNTQQVMKTVSALWSKMPNDEKDYYKEQSKVDRKRYEEQKNAYEAARDEAEAFDGKKRSLRERKPKLPEPEETLPERKQKPKKKKLVNRKSSEIKDSDLNLTA